MFHNPSTYAMLPVGVVLQRRPGVTRWVKWVWSAVAVLPGAGPADWRTLRDEGDVTEYHAATLPLELFGSDTEAYREALSSTPPSVYVILRSDGSGDASAPLEVAHVTASPYEAQDYTDSGEDQVEKVAMPAGLVAWIRDFVEAHHEDEVFVKRKRDRVRTDRKQDGLGDPRVEKPADIYASPSLKRRRLQ